MKKYFSRLLLLLAAAIAPVFVSAQAMPAIPVDPEVRIGKLDNGLTYYIRHNEYPKGQADYYIAQKVGSIQEEDNQRGLAHFLEHMCFNGTKNFPGNEVVSWLETVGVKFGQNLNAYTSVDETVYNICNVPTARESVQDSCLLILHDWADGLLLEDAEIDKERGVIHEEWRRSNVGQMRIYEKLLPVIYPDSKYAYRLPIGTMEIVDNFPYQDLRDYYEKWYRPDLQGIVVVGDIDVDRIEAKIKEIFSDIKMPVNPAERVYYPVPDNQNTIFAVGSDPEQRNAVVQIMFKSEATPDSLKGTLDYLVGRYAVDMLDAMLNARFQELSSKPDAVFALADASYGNFMLSKTADALTVAALPKDGDLIPAFEAVYRETLRAKRGGFTATEYDRARSEYLSRLEKAYNNRANTTSTSLVNEYVRHFLDNEPIPGIENEFTMMSMLANQIPVEMINMALPEIVGDKNIVVLAMLPEAEGFAVPTEAQLAEAMQRVDAEEIEAFVDDVKSEPLIESLPAPGKIVAVTENPLYNTQEWTLSNGVKVVVKKTDFKDNEILFTALATGGTSVFGEDDALNLRYLPYALSRHGLGGYSSSDLEKYLAGKQASCEVDLSAYTREVSGSAVPKDLPVLMELIYATFTGFTISPDDFSSTQNLYVGALKNQEALPAYQFNKQLLEYLFKSGRSHAVDVNTIENADRGRILEIVGSQLANAADYTFYFVGNVDIDALKPLVEQYIATLPAVAGKTAPVKLAGLGIEPGASTEQVRQKMDTPTTYAAIIVSADMPYTAKNQKLASIAGQILSARLIKTVREEEGAVYSISANGSLSRISDNPVMFQSSFPMKPEMKDKVLEIIAAQFDDMTANITAEELAKVKEYMVKEATRGMTENQAWLSGMTGYQLLPVDTFLTSVDTINAITEDDVKAFMAELMKQNNYKVFVMEPAE
ncbi:MAG: insulinase family protein [Muribaculum sp.]|nr:insulinase family protein [Muribaculum sp.]